MEWLGKILDRSKSLSEYKEEARGWKTCAVGEAHEALPLVVAFSNRGLFGAIRPQDRALETLGCSFYEAVKKDQRSKALAVYVKIQKRVARLAGSRIR